MARWADREPVASRARSGTLSFSSPVRSPRSTPPTPDDVRVAVDRALARAYPGGVDAWESPREVAVQLALREGLTAEEALGRCGVDVPPPTRSPVAFGRVPYGSPFRLGGVRYQKVTAKTARRLAAGAPNAEPLDEGEAVWLAPDHPVEHIPTTVVPKGGAGEPAGD